MTYIDNRSLMEQKENPEFQKTKSVQNQFDALFGTNTINQSAKRPGKATALKPITVDVNITTEQRDALVKWRQYDDLTPPEYAHLNAAFNKLALAAIGTKTNEQAA